MTFSKRLKELRKQKKVSQKELAKGSGVPFYTLVAIENDRSKVQMITTVIKLARYFKLDIDTLIKGVEF